MKYRYKFIFSISLLLILMVLVLFTGAMDIDLSNIFIFGASSLSSDIVWKIRLPRMVISIAAGGGLALSGLLLQTWFKNQLADPFLLGIHSGSSLGVAIYVLGSSSLFSSVSYFRESGIVLFGIAGALSILFIMMFVASKFRGSIYIIIFGVVISFFITGVINLILSFSSSDELKHFFLWSLGSFDRISFNESLFVLSIVSIISLNLYRYSHLLNVCLLGDDYAKESGVDLSLLRKIIIPSVGLISGVVSVYCGPVIFIGLMAPHLTRMIFLTSNHRILIPASFLLGAGLCLLVTLFSNGYFIGFSVPINALLGLLGTPFVLVLLVRSSFSNGGGGYV